MGFNSAFKGLMTSSQFYVWTTQ